MHFLLCESYIFYIISNEKLCVYRHLLRIRFDEDHCIITHFQSDLEYDVLN